MNEDNGQPAPKTEPSVPDDIATRILDGFRKGELPSWMTRTSYNSAILKVGLVDGETVKITAPIQRIAEAKETTNEAVLELLMKRAVGEEVDPATLEEARARASRAAIDYLAGVITEFGPAIRFERPLIVGDQVLFEKGGPIPPLFDVKDPAAREAIVKDHLAPGVYVQLMLGAQGLSIPAVEIFMASPGNASGGQVGSSAPIAAPTAARPGRNSPANTLSWPSRCGRSSGTGWRERSRYRAPPGRTSRSPSLPWSPD